MMDKHSFKIGDKVRACDSSKWKKRLGNTIGVVTGLVGTDFRVVWETDKCIFLCGVNEVCNTPINTWTHFPNEIELVAKVGGQLMLSFMRTSD